MQHPLSRISVSLPAAFFLALTQILAAPDGGGKTSTGPGLGSTGPPYDGWFAGLVFDPQERARFTVATYVRHGGLRGENAAIISAQLARYLVKPVTSNPAQRIRPSANK